MGYDAITQDGRKVQIKARCILAGAGRGQRVGQIKLDHEWDSVALILMNDDFVPIAIYEADREPIRTELERPERFTFHLEMIVERVWQKATSLPAMPAALAATLKAGAGWVRAAHPDPWTASGQRLDSYLTTTTRAAVAKTMDEDAVRAQAALDYVAAGQIAKAFDRWSVVFGRSFPAFG